MQGLKKPHQCSAFGTLCTPERPLGAPMVSSEGACAAYYHFAQIRRRRHRMTLKSSSAATCPIPISDYPTVTLAHGGGGRLTQMLIERMFLPAFNNPQLEQQHDGALLEVNGARLAFSTDSFVVSPLFFPGGDIGSLAVHGTVNDLAMCGAQPLALSAGLILEEGLPMEDLWRVVQSMQAAAAGGGRAGRHRRHQGGGPRQGRRRLHQHQRHRA